MKLPPVARLLLTALVLLLGVRTTAFTQTQSMPIEPFVPYEGELTVPGATDLWTFNGLEGGIVSVLVTSDSALDPIIELRNSSGQLLTSNDDFAYPGRRDALIQAATLPRIDTYSIAVYGFGQTIGTYTLTFMPGYADPALSEPFDSAGRWRETGDTGAVIEAVDGQLQVTVEGVRVPVPILDTNGPTFSTFFASAQIEIIRGGAGWRAGLTVRGTPDGTYGVMLGDGGSWRMDYYPAEGEPRQIRDWTFHPAIQAGLTEFTVSVLANGPAFDVLVNDAWVGQAIDTGGGPESGTVGVFAATPDVIGAGMTVAFDELIVTRPLKVGEADVMPTQIVPGGQALTVQELERRLVIPTGGRASLTVPESSGRQIEAGVNRVLLGRGVTFTDYVAYTTFTLTTAMPDALVGCGLLLANLSDTQHVVAFLDRQGGYGISARDGANFSPGLFGENEAFAGGQRHTLIVTKIGTRTEMWVDRVHVGGFDLPARFAQAGQVGNAVVNYERSDTSCSFSDTWVWELP